MKGGDISNEVQSRLIFVWDDLLFHIDDADRKRELKYRKRRKWDDAIALWAEDFSMSMLLSDILWRQSIPVDLLCIHEPQFAVKLNGMLSEGEYPFRKMYCDETPLLFTDKMVRRPEIGQVFYPSKWGPILFGSKGTPVKNIEDIQRALPSKWT